MDIASGGFATLSPGDLSGPCRSPGSLGDTALLRTILDRLLGLVVLTLVLYLAACIGVILGNTAIQIASCLLADYVDLPSGCEQSGEPSRERADAAPQHSPHGIG